MVVGMVVLAIALVLLATLLYPLAGQSAHGVHRAKAAQLGQAVLAELAARPLDINTPIGGGTVSTLNCSRPPSCDDLATKDWALLDCFDGFRGNADSLFDLDGHYYQGLNVAIDISCPSNAWLSGWLEGAKLVEVTVTAPDGESFDFARVRGNF
jgi:MSHA pilin protein MshD